MLSGKSDGFIGADPGIAGDTGPTNSAKSSLNRLILLLQGICNGSLLNSFQDTFDS